MKFKNGKTLFDTNGDIVHAHGGQIISLNNSYYWIGEDRRGHHRVACYQSKDLINWEFKNVILSLKSISRDHYIETDTRLVINGDGCNIERPKVIYNEQTNQFVMWMHWESPCDYSQARCAVAVCDKIDGDYTYLGSFNPFGYMSRDCTLFKDDDGKGYFISTARENADIHLYRLSKDYLSIEEHVKILWPGQHREAPVLFKRNGLYYMLTSGCTGWKPNQSKYAISNALDGEWSELFDFGDTTTYRSQPTWVLPVEKSGEKQYLYIGDRWGGSGENYFKSSYIFLPIKFNSDKNITIEYYDEIIV